MGYIATQVGQAVADIYGAKPHPDVPEIKVSDYTAFARVAARMFYTRAPKPDQVQVAYHALTNAEIAPAEFERLWDVAKPLSTQLLNRDPTIHDLVLLRGQVPSAIQTYYNDHPHPDHPDVAAGDIARYARAALYPARALQGREPHTYELAKFASLNYTMDDVVAHYSDKGM